MKVLVPGSFRPFTIGHKSVYDAAVAIFGVENTYIGSAQNPNKKDLDVDHQKWVLNAVTHRSVVLPKGKLLADYCDENGFDLVVKSLRNSIDLVYEMDMAHWNKSLGVQTIFIPCAEGLQKISSSAIRELHSFGKDVSSYLPPFVYERWQSMPTRIVVTGKIAAGKSSFIEEISSIFPKVKDHVVDMDIVAKEILPIAIRSVLKDKIDCRVPFERRDLQESGDILYDKLLQLCPLNKIFEVSALGTYTEFDTNALNKLYIDSVIINVNHFDSGKERVLDETFKQNILAKQKEPLISDFVIDDRVMGRFEIQQIAKKALGMIGCKNLVQ